jgi:hypothetical protein
MFCMQSGMHATLHANVLPPVVQGGPVHMRCFCKVQQMNLTYGTMRVGRVNARQSLDVTFSRHTCGAPFSCAISIEALCCMANKLRHAIQGNF